MVGTEGSRTLSHVARSAWNFENYWSVRSQPLGLENQAHPHVHCALQPYLSSWCCSSVCSSTRHGKCHIVKVERAEDVLISVPIQLGSRALRVDERPRM
jgi:hypothetical protein